jgi:S-adenosylmethionine:tRNA ribosyltransferase-isomerase
LKHPSQISISEFNYELPEEKIAKKPLEERDQSRLLIYRDQKISEDIFQNVAKQLPARTLLVFNDTRVIQARLIFKNAKRQEIEVFCLEPSEEHQTIGAGLAATENAVWNCLVGRLKRWTNGPLTIIKNEVQLTASFVEQKAGYGVVSFSWVPTHYTFALVLETVGNIPLPPYLNRAANLGDKKSYQTVYSKNEGSVAAPTAGLHFTDAVIKEIKDRAIETVKVTLHVGAGTFKPVKAEKLAGHEMHAEWLDVDAEILELLSGSQSRTVIAVGTTSLRTIETLYWMGVKAKLKPEASLHELEITQWEIYDQPDPGISVEDSLIALLNWLKSQGLKKLVCRTQIMIAPPYQLKIADGLITNFHQPQSTLLLLVAAVVGEDWKKIYDYALARGFRFLSYGDGSLLLK